MSRPANESLGETGGEARACIQCNTHGIDGGIGGRGGTGA